MLLEHSSPLSEQKRSRLDAITEVLAGCDHQIRKLMDDHQRMSVRWTSHDILPWGKGRDFTEEPWRPEDRHLPADVALAFETNLLTEDNLPYYHAQIAAIVPPDSSLAEWIRIWTAEEGGHAIAMRDYALLTRLLDPDRLESNRLAIMRHGFGRDFADPLEVFAYTSIQELATRISHMKLGQKAGEPVLQKLMLLISRDENFHYIFYRSLVKMVLDVAPDLMLPAIVRQFYSFEMPGAGGIESFDERTRVSAELGIYGALEHRDLVIKPVLQYWGIEKLCNLSPESQRAQERIMRLVQVLDRIVERQQPRSAPASELSTSLA